MAEINLKGVCKRYEQTSIIENLNLTIRDQEFMVLVGPSGCGKSTTLRMLAGLEEISDGELHIGGRLVNDVPPKDRNVAMVFQSYALYPHMTVRENIQFGLKIRKTPKEEMDRLVNEAANMLGISHLLERKPKALSGGQRQRVALGRAIVRQPKVFLFDEPLSNLDAELRVQMRAEISKLQRRMKVTSVYVTHDQVEAMTMGDRITVMKGGVIMQVGRPLELYNKPENLFVARFIGTPPMNVFEGSVSAQGDKIVAETFEMPVLDKYRDGLKAYAGQKIFVGIRPSHIELAQRSDGSLAKFNVEVEITEPLGHEVIVHARAGSNKFVATLPPYSIPSPGSMMELFIDCSKLHLFDVKTEKRINEKDDAPVKQ